MDANTLKILQLSQQGYPCSQIMLLMGLEVKGEENPDLVRAVQGLAQGGFNEKMTCGALTGACCMISLFGGRAYPDEYPHLELKDMVTELVDWFENVYGKEFGGMICCDIRQNGNALEKKQRCGDIIAATCNKALEILAQREMF